MIPRDARHLALRYLNNGVLLFIWTTVVWRYDPLRALMISFLPNPDVLSYVRWSIGLSEWGRSPLLAVTVPTVLMVAQVVLLVVGGRMALLHFVPVTRSWPVIGRSDGSALAAAQLRRPWWVAPATMGFLTLYTVGLVTALAGSLLARQGAWQALDAAGIWPVAVAGVLTGLGLVSGWRFSASARQQVTALTGAQLVPDDHWLAARVHRLADALGLPHPAVGLMRQVNAYAVGDSPEDAAVVLGIPLVRAMTADELDAVIGHELGHIAATDLRQRQILAGYQQMFGSVMSFLTLAVTSLAAGATRDRSTASVVRSLGQTADQILAAIVFVAGELQSKGLSRYREYYADAVGAALTSPESMSGALSRLETIATAPTAGESRYAYLMFHTKGTFRPFATHPTLAQRRAALAKGTYVKALPRSR